MRDFKKVLKEVNIIVDEILLFDVILNSVIIFLGTYLLLMFLNLNPWYALLITLGYFVYLLYKDLQKNKYVMVEEVYEPLYESLRTAADYVDEETEIVQELKQEVVEKLRHVPVSSFVKTSRITAKMFSSVLLCFIILLAAIYNIHIPTFNLSEAIPEWLIGTGDNTDAEDTAFGVSKGEADFEDLYGETTIATLGNEELTMNIKRASIETVGAFIEDPPEQEFDELFPDEVFATSSGSFEEKISQENQQLIKNYFKEIQK